MPSATPLVCFSAQDPASLGFAEMGQQVHHEGFVLTLASQGCPGREQEAHQNWRRKPHPHHPLALPDLRRWQDQEGVIAAFAKVLVLTEMSQFCEHTVQARAWPTFFLLVHCGESCHEGKEMSVLPVRYHPS